MSKIKICGLRRIDDIFYVNELKPEYIGFIFATGRRRTVTIHEAAVLKKELDEDIKAVGVFLDQEISYILEAVKNNTLDLIQLHGKEDNTFISELRNELQHLYEEQKIEKEIPKIIKAASISSRDDILIALETKADMLLLDNHIPGSGMSFDWSLLKEVEREFILAGGLCQENIDEALSIHPFAVDISSGVETNGVKDYNKMERLINTIRAYA